jgi:hypothetical protein
MIGMKSLIGIVGIVGFDVIVIFLLSHFSSGDTKSMATSSTYNP